MDNRKSLAIVIPAYKSTFLSAALDSIAAQTCKDFTLYIGDDCSPNNIGEIVDRYRDKIDLVYKRFDSNLGGHDLVAQWERCIDLTQGEPWLWLFSDDDVMEANCVEEFYKLAYKSPSHYFHFNIREIGADGLVKKELPAFPPHLSAVDYLEGKTAGWLVSFVIEYIFDKEFFLKAGRFVNFDMAWGSDYITTLKLADLNKGIDTIPNAKVSWRSSDENISPNKSTTVLKKKMTSVVENLFWIKNFVKNKTNIKYSRKYYKYFFGEMMRINDYLDRRTGNELIYYFGKRMNLKSLSTLFKLYWNLTK